MDQGKDAFELVVCSGSTPHVFTAFVPDDVGGRLAEHAVEWRTDSTDLALTLGELARAAASGTPPEHDLHRTFGQRLFKTFFAGPVAELWQQRFTAARRSPVPLRVRLDPKSARELLKLPWEYLHDGQDFLALNWRTPVARLPWGLRARTLPVLTEPLRMLVVVAAPLGLHQKMVLNSAREEDLILAATSAARRSGQLEIEFTPAGSLEALEEALRTFDPHLLHFTGHGVFVEDEDTGYLIMETADGHERLVPNAEFAELLERRARSLRFVFLSACESAIAPRQEGYADLAPRLLAAGIPAVVAMQASVLNRSAMDFGSVLYKGLADGDPIDAALTEARSALAKSSLNGIDFAVPVLFLSDPSCLKVDARSVQAARPQTPLDLTGVARAQNFVGRSAELRALATGLDPEHGPWRAAIVHGLGGMGKTVLAARLAERLASRLDGVKSIRMTPTTTARDVLGQIAGFLLVNQMRLNHPRITDLSRLLDEPLALEVKVAALAEILTSLRLLLIFDNCEDFLPAGQVVSRAESDASVERAGQDPDLLKLFRLLLESVPGPSRFLFTSRVDFSPLEVGRLSDAIGHLPLSEMGFRDAVYLMETLPPLSDLPVAAVASRQGEGLPASATPLSMRDVFGKLGGHPYTLNLFAEHARRSSVQAVLDDLAQVRKELIEFTLLDRAVAQLPERAATLLRRAAVHEEPVPAEGLAFLLGDDHDAMPGVADELQALLGWGLLAHPPGTQDFALHALVRDWACGQWTSDERLALLRRAAAYWLAVGRDTQALDPYLNARQYLFQAGDFEQADDIVSAATELLRRWGQIELLLRLLDESIRTVQGNRRAVARSNLGTVYQALGDYAQARTVNEQVLAEFEASGDRRNVAASLDQLGTLHQSQGEYPQARQRYEQSLAIRNKIGDKASVAASLLNLGVLHQDQGEYLQARQRYEQSLATFQDLGDQTGVAASVLNLGMLHHDQGEYPQARQRYEQSLATFQDLGDQTGVAASLHRLGVLHQDQSEYPQARQRYEQSLTIRQELGDKAGVARSFHELGILHQAQGEYPQARQRYEQSLAIKQELGDKAGIGSSLHQLGMLFEVDNDLSKAVVFVAQAFAILQQLGSPDQQIAGRTLARLREKLGEAAFEKALRVAKIEAPPANANDGSAQGMTLEQAVRVIVNNTVAVFTQAQDKKSEWEQVLGQLQSQVAAQGLTDFAAFLGLARQLIEGAEHERLMSQVPEPFRQAWSEIVKRIDS